MGMKCPKYQTDNPSDSKYCKECATPLPLSGEVSVTKTLETPVEGLKRGTTFAERYEIIEGLGTGGMGKVYRVKDEKLDEEMALKVLKPEIAADKGMIERFKNELKLARKIAHRSVCKMYDLNEEEGTHFITMEYVTGEDLKSYIRKKGKISEEDAISIAKQVCEGLSEAHELGVVHRDLKPQNIMIDKKRRAKIMDFGIARSVQAPGVTQTGVMIGTPDYISPEQAEGEEADQRSDIYALGVILYEMVTGSVPFKGDTALSVALKHKAQLPQDPKKLNPEVSEDLSRLILICMEKDRRRRYQTTEDILSDLTNVEDGLPLGTKIRPRRDTFAAALIRKKIFIPVLVAVLAAIAVVILRFLPQQEAAPSAPSGKPSLAVMYFDNNTGDQDLDHWRKALSELLIADLSQSKYLNVLPGDRLYKILSEMNQLEAKSYSSDVLEEVASRGAVENILRGSYTKAGDAFRVNVMLQNASTGEPIGSERAEGKGEESFFSIVDELTRKVKGNFNLTAEEIASDIDREVGEITTSSPEAYKNFSAGIKYEFIGEWRKAIQFYGKAIAIDPEFASAYVSIGIMYSDLGYSSEAKKYYKKGLEFSDRVSDGERYRIEGTFYMQSEKTYDKAIQAFNKLLELYPEDMIGNQDLGVIYNFIEQWDKAIERLEVNLRNKVTDSTNYVNLSYSYRAKGLYDKAGEILEYYLNNFSDSARIHWYLALNYLCQGKYEIALVEADKAFSLDPSYWLTPWIKGDIYHCTEDLIKAEIEYKKLLETEEQVAQVLARFLLGALYLLEGSFKKSEIEFSQGIDLAKKIGDEWWESRQHFRLAYVHLRSGVPEEALKECNKAWSGAVEVGNTSWQRYILHLKGLTYLEIKSIDEALETANELKELIMTGMNRKHMRYYFHLMGMIELERDNLPKAIEYFKQAVPLLPHQKHWYHFHPEDHPLFLDSLASAYYKAGDNEKAQQEYEKITSLTTGRIYYGDICAKSFYMLGKIYELKGWKGKAIEHYEKFLDLWKDADPGIPEVEDARKRLAGLKELF